MSEKYDVVIVGAGCAGAVLATRMAERGFRVLMIERRRREEIGQNWCDLVENESFELSGIEPPAPPEACPPFRSMDVLSPDTTASISIPDYPYRPINRKLLSERLLARAGNAGVELVTQCIATGLGVENGSVVSVTADRETYPCRVAVDASGLDRVLCRDIPKGMGIPRRLRTGDYISVYRELRDVSPEAGGGLVKGVARYYIGRYGGFSWVHADEEGRVEVGTAVQDGRDSPDPREMVLGYVRSTPEIGDEIIRMGGGRIPTRRPLNTMVASGLMIIGDAACQATPLMGRGVGMAMVGAAIAADAASFALEAGDTGTAGLWSYNHAFMKERGAHMAALDCLRIFLQGIPEKDFSWTLSKGMLDAGEIKAALSGRFEAPSSQAKIKTFLKGLKAMPLVVRLEGAMRHAQKIQELYRQYPKEYDPPEYSDWEQEADYLFEHISRI